MVDSIAELRRVAWIGGAMDAKTRLVKMHVPAGQHYFEWHQHAAIRDWLFSDPKKPTLVIAHSYGASTIARLIAQGNRVTELVTLDPVSWRKPDGVLLRRYCGHWRNYVAMDTRPNFANLVARAGGWWQHWPQEFAHQHIEVAADHGMIVNTVLRQWRNLPTPQVA